MPRDVPAGRTPPRSLAQLDVNREALYLCAIRGSIPGLLSIVFNPLNIMGAVFSMFRRAYQALISPPRLPKKDGAVRFGLLGASAIAPIALIGPAQSHAEAIIAAVAARDPARAAAYAKKHHIPIALTNVDLLDDPSIDAVYIALPNGHHYEWSIRALEAGKHVLLEKPSTSNAIEAKKLFSSPLLNGSKAPVLLEAFHYQFHPAWQTFLDEVRRAGTAQSASARAIVPTGLIRKDDIRFQYAIAGGAMMDLGTYPLSCVRQVMHRDGVKTVDSAQHRGLPMHAEGTSPEPQIDTAMKASFGTTAGGRCTIEADLMASAEYLSFLPREWRLRVPSIAWPKCEVVMEEVPFSDQHDAETEHLVQKVIIMWNFMLPVIYHRIDVAEKHRILRHGKEIKSWKETTYKKAYHWAADDPRLGQYKDYFTTWRAQLEEFVNRVKGRQGSGVWVDGEESVRQMEGIDAIYTKAGLAIRPSSRYASE